MSNVKAFVEARGQYLNVLDPQRVTLGNSHRVTVPPIRLEKDSPSFADHRAKTSIFPVRHAPAKQGSFHGQQPTSFDTDAESLEDTTTMGVSAQDNIQPSLTTTAGHRYLIDSFRGDESSGGPAQISNETEHDAALSSGSDGDDDQGSQNYKSLEDRFRSEEFRNFKKHNALDKQFDLDFQYALHPAAESATGAFSDLEASDPPQRSRDSQTSSLIYPAPRADPKARLNHISTGNIAVVDTAFRRRKDTEQGPAKTPKYLYRVPLGEIQPLSRLANPFLSPSGQSSAAHAGSVYTPAEAIPVVGGPNCKTSYCLDPSIRHGQDDSIPEISDKETMETVANGEHGVGSLKRSRSLDHDLDQLGTMTFQQLRDDCFDNISAKGIATEVPQSTAASLKVKLEDLCVITDLARRDEQQQAFFDMLTIGQYKVSGDIIGQKLSELIALLSSIRESKREVAAEFETEIAKRESIIGRKASVLKVEKTRMMLQTQELATYRSS